MSSGKVLLGILAGAAAGALLGILFAPEKGTVTRKKITKKGEDYADSLKEKFNEVLDNFTERFEGVKKDVSEFAETGKVKADEVKREAKNAMV